MRFAATYQSKAQRFAAGERGATAVEFAILLPLMMVVLAAVIEGARIYWNYQSAVSGVRDAARYLARVTNDDICPSATGRADAATIANDIVRRNMGSGSTNLFPVGVTLVGMPAVTYSCLTVSGISDQVPVVQVQASIQIALPLEPLFDYFITFVANPVTSTITDQSRVYGI